MKHVDRAQRFILFALLLPSGPVAACDQQKVQIATSSKFQDRIGWWWSWKASMPIACCWVNNDDGFKYKKRNSLFCSPKSNFELFGSKNVSCIMLFSSRFSPGKRARGLLSGVRYSQWLPPPSPVPAVPWPHGKLYRGRIILDYESKSGELFLATFGKCNKQLTFD